MKVERTFVFVDLSGFTKYTANHGDIAAGNLLTKFRAEVREVAAAWAPFCSVATWYIWRSLDPLPVEY